MAATVNPQLIHEFARVSSRGALQAVAGPFDLWWHSTSGFDPTCSSPRTAC